MNNIFFLDDLEKLIWILSRETRVHANVLLINQIYVNNIGLYLQSLKS